MATVGNKMSSDAMPSANGSTTSAAEAEAISNNMNNTSGVTNLAFLTDEILLEILYCLSPLEVLYRVCRVSKRLAGITTSRDAALRYWRYHPKLPRSLRERLRREEDTDKKKASGLGGNNGRNEDTKPGARPLNVDRRQLQMLVCLCTNARPPLGMVRDANTGAPATDGVLPKLLRHLDLLPSQEMARSTSVEMYGGLMLRRRCCLASSEDHEHEDVKRVLRHVRRTKNGDDEVVQRLRARAGMHVEEDSDDNGGGDYTTDDADADEDEEEIRKGRAVPKASETMGPNPSYDALWDFIGREEPDLGPPRMNGHIDLGFFMRVMRQEGTYWSSDQSESCNTDEVLLFATQGCQHSLISDFAIKPFRELRLDEGHVAYNWPKAVVSVYSLPDVDGDDDDVNDRDEESKEDGRKNSVWCNGNVTEPPSSALERQSGRSPKNPIPAILAGHNPVYTSGARECDATNTGWQRFQLPPEVVGNVVVITLSGKFNRQFPESGYFVCCERVECRGVPLWSAP
mmetsp:Transcript_20687/g.59307  ORF Transcript_20687/g.59307 Transcript_20687/m.59307 type:complete len:514 (+) Transcript_20687:324-1865(+)